MISHHKLLGYRTDLRELTKRQDRACSCFSGKASFNFYSYKHFRCSFNTPSGKAMFSTEAVQNTLILTTSLTHLCTGGKFTSISFLVHTMKWTLGTVWIFFLHRGTSEPPFKTRSETDENVISVLEVLKTNNC